MRNTLLLLIAILLAAPAGAQPTLGECQIGPGLGSTLLIPYFEVDLTDPDGLTTLISINNGLSTPTLVRVVLWTDWGVPTLAFDLYLTGFDMQSIDLRTFFDGNVPSTGEGADLSAFDFCDILPPDHDNPVLDADERDQLAADHTGRLGPLFPDCSGQFHGDRIARGYVTADVVDECSDLETPAEGTPVITPADPLDFPYFVDGGGSESVAIIDNRLWGDAVFVDFPGAAAQGSEAVAIWADADLFTGEDVFTFYGRFKGYDGRDDRVPLPYLWNQRFLNGGAFAGGADLIVFRDIGTDTEVADCGTQPSWWPLTDISSARDEQAGNFTAIGDGETYPIATQRVSVSDLGIPFAFGRIQANTLLGSWVQPTLTASGIFSVTYNGVPALTTCDATPSAVLGGEALTSPAQGKNRLDSGTASKPDGD